MQPRQNTALQSTPATPAHLLAALDESWDHEPLAQAVQRSADPDFDAGADAGPGFWPSLAAKYFFAYVHPGSEDNPVPVVAVRELLEQFARQASLNEPDDDIETMNLLRRHSRSLAPLADPALAGHVLRAVACMDLDREPDPDGPGFLGVDLFSGAGWLVLAQNLLAKRHGFDQARVLGLEPDEGAARRSRMLLERLGLGETMHADPADPATPSLIPGPPDFVSTGGYGWHDPILTRSGYFAALANLSRAAGGLAPRACFPEGLVVYSRDTGVSLLLSRSNLFQAPSELADSQFTVQGLYFEDRLTPLHKLGERFRSG